MTASYLDYSLHAANVILLAAYSVRDILRLRVLAVVSALVAMPYFLLQPTPLWAAAGWGVLFAGINSLQAWRLLVERRPVKLTDEEEEVRTLVFHDLPPKKVLQVISVGTWASAAPGERLIERGRPLESISLVVRGKVRVTQEGRLLGELGRGEVVGSAPERRTRGGRCSGGGDHAFHPLERRDTRAVPARGSRHPQPLPAAHRA